MTFDREIELPPPTAPLEVAKIFVTEQCQQGGAPTLLYWRGGWLAYNGAGWGEQSADTIRARLYEFTGKAVYVRQVKGEKEIISWLPNDRRISALVDALKSVCLVPAELGARCWLDGRKTGTIIACRNGLLELKSRELIPHTPRYFNLTTLPFDYDPAAECPTWEKFMDDLWPGDDEPPNALEEMMGCAVAGKLDLQRIGVLIGPSRSGKSVIAAIFAALVGETNATWPALAGLADDGIRSSLIGKSLCVFADVRATAGKTPAIAEALLGISGQDSFTINRKYKEAWIGSLSTFLLMISNEFPTLKDASGALPRRYLPLILTESWLGREDRSLKARLLAELSGILNRALDGLEAVENSGRFTEPRASQGAAEELADMASPMKRFVDERIVEPPEGATRADYTATVDAVFRAYNAWADANHEERINKAWLGQRLHAVLPRITRSQLRAEDGSRTPTYVGLRLLQGETTVEKLARAAVTELSRRTGKTVRVIAGDGEKRERE